MRILSNKGWPAEEASTRNCFNAKLVPMVGHNPRPTVHCGKGHELDASYNGVIKSDGMQAACAGCPDINNNWQVN